MRRVFAAAIQQAEEVQSRPLIAARTIGGMIFVSVTLAMFITAGIIAIV